MENASYLHEAVGVVMPVTPDRHDQGFEAADDGHQARLSGYPLPPVALSKRPCQFQVWAVVEHFECVESGLAEAGMFQTDRSQSLIVPESGAGDGVAVPQRWWTLTPEVAAVNVLHIYVACGDASAQRSDPLARPEHLRLATVPADVFADFQHRSRVTVASRNEEHNAGLWSDLETLQMQP